MSCRWQWCATLKTQWTASRKWWKHFKWMSQRFDLGLLQDYEMISTFGSGVPALFWPSQRSSPWWAVRDELDPVSLCPTWNESTRWTHHKTSFSIHPLSCRLKWDETIPVEFWQLRLSTANVALYLHRTPTSPSFPYCHWPIHFDKWHGVFRDPPPLF